jgi:hypothetical protein
MNAILLIYVFLIAGCASMNPYTAKYQELDTAYANGMLTYAEYMNLKKNLSAQEYRERQDAANSVSQTFDTAIAHNNEAFERQKKIAGVDKPAWGD